LNRISRATLSATLTALIALLCACGKESTTAGAPVVTTVTATATVTAKGATARPATKPPKVASISPCVNARTEAAIAPGEAPSERIWDSAIVVTNRGTVPCTLQGVSQLELYAGGDGKPLGIKEITTDGAPRDLVTLRPSEQASMAMVVHTSAAKLVPTDCLEGASFAEVTLPGDSKAIEAWLPDRAMWLPPVCGAVEVSPWGKGGAPGVPGGN
jgi:uncharacterized protein DUF4232